MKQNRYAFTTLTLATLLLLPLAGSGCFSTTVAANAPAVVSADTTLEPGVTFREVDSPNEIGTRTHLWVYLPAGATGKIPCIVIGAAGTPLIWGMDLGEGDRPEHLPYVRAGFAVVAYSLEGAVSRKPSDQEVMAGMAAFRKAHAGYTDTRAAIDYALKALPQVDPKRLYAVGHSSAATLALLAGENDSRIKACVAYAPPTDNVRDQAQAIPSLQALVPDIVPFLQQTSPITHAANLRYPLFLFHADDDSNVPTDQVTEFRDKVSLTNPHVTYVSVPRGDHYQSMIDDGIPRGIAWLKALP